MNTNMMLIGGIAVAGLAVALFFLRFWRSTGDRFFLYFALAFVLEGANRIPQAWMEDRDGSGPLFYIVRLVASGRADPKGVADTVRAVTGSTRIRSSACTPRPRTTA